MNEYDGQNVNSLAERSYTDRTNLSRAVAMLEKDGCVERRRETQDQRNVFVFLTEKGDLKFNAALPAVLEDINFVLEGLTSNEISLLMELLNKMKRNSYRTRRRSSMNVMEEGND